MEKEKPKRYRVEARASKDDYVRADCYEEDLEMWKEVCRASAKSMGCKCYYREFPVSKAKKIYF